MILSGGENVYSTEVSSVYECWPLDGSPCRFAGTAIQSNLAALHEHIAFLG